MAQRTVLALNFETLPEGARVCVAISGGADSTALLLSLREAVTPGPQNRIPLEVSLSAAHVHHGLRGAEADGDEEFVRNLCERVAVPLTVFRVDTAARQAAEGEGLEEAARTLRYGVLCGMLAEGSVDVIATAHTLDDQAETVVMKMLRGAWTEGLGGISPVAIYDGGKVVRPFLEVRRSEVEAFLTERGQGWRDDSSNKDLSLTRNRVRHELMPILRSFNPGLDGLLGRTAEIARDDEAFWKVEVARILPQVLLPGKPVRGGGRAVGTAVGEASNALELTRLSAMAPALRRRLVRAAARQVGVGMSSEETAKVIALGGFGGFRGVTGRIGSRLELHDGLRVERSARELRFSCVAKVV